nr:15375_t:CDS:2 [Entrophospora candida]
MIKGKIRNDEKVEVEHIDKSLYPGFFPEKNELNELIDKDEDNDDAKEAGDFTWFIDPKYENPQGMLWSYTHVASRFVSDPPSTISK